MSMDNNEVFNKPLLQKPVPLPRKSLHKTVIHEDEAQEEIYSNESVVNIVNKEPVKMENAQNTKTSPEKVRLRSEFEKSIRRMIPKRRSVAPKESTKIRDEHKSHSQSLPDGNIFQNISFSSPFLDASSPLIPRASFAKSEKDEDGNSDSESVGTSSDNPPSYPPPPLPDESTYDELTSVSSDGPNSYYSPESDSNSLYEELSNYLSNSLDTRDRKEKTRTPSVSESWTFYDSASAGSAGSRYEEIDDLPDSPQPTLTPEIPAVVEMRRPNIAKPSQTSKSVILQFDPLMEKSPQSWETFCSDSAKAVSKEGLGLNPFQDPNILSFLTDRPEYGTISKKHESVLSDCDALQFELPSVSGPPPVPPRRIDSAVLDNPSGEPLYTQPQKSADKRRSINRWESIKRVAKFVTDNIENTTLRRNEKKGLLLQTCDENVKNEEAESENRTSLYNNESDDIYVPLVLHHSGVLYRPGGGKRWGVLAQRKLTIFANKDSPDVKETVPVDSILSLRICNDNKIRFNFQELETSFLDGVFILVQNLKSFDFDLDSTNEYPYYMKVLNNPYIKKILLPSVEGEQVASFAVSLSGKSQEWLVGTASPPERHVWMRKLLESVTPGFPPKLALDYEKAGWCFMKEGISSAWIKSSILLSQRCLHLVPNNGSLVTADLRKARTIVLQEGDLQCKKTSEKGAFLVVDMQDSTVYLQMDTVQETTTWQQVIRSNALQNGPTLAQQQLTKDDVPTIVEKAINFTHTHGSASEGIYRRSGGCTAMSKLLSAFRKDAWSVQLLRSEYSEFDVSSVLKRFFRELAEPLIVPELHPELRSIAENGSLRDEERLRRYHEVLKKLPRVNYMTTRRLMGHLYFIDKLRSKNLMPVENLAAIWGPTLMHVQEGVSLDVNWSRVESAVVSELISNYPRLFEVSEAELQRELQILSVLDSFHNQSTQMPKMPSGDLKVWVYLHSHLSGDCVSVAVPPGKLAREMCDELSGKMSLPGHAMCLQEMVCNGQLRRPLHHSECVLDVVLRWGHWSEEDRRDNCLVLTPSTFLQELLPLINTPLLPIADELKYVDFKAKSFKTYLFELNQTSLCYYKDKSCSVKVRDWAVRDLIWYIGHESKRNPQAGWSITFITTDSPQTRSKDRPFFGHTLCGSTEQQKRKWMAAFMMAAHPAGILPPPVLIE